MSNSRGRKPIQRKGRQPTPLIQANPPPSRQLPLSKALPKGLRAVGFGGVVIGVGVGVLSTYFWPAVFVVYIGMASLFVDALIEPEFNPIRRTVACIFLFLITAVFTRYIVFSRAPLDYVVASNDSSYSGGTVVGGVTWRPEFAETFVSIKNDSDVDYENINLNLRTTETMTGIGQLSSIPNCFFQVQYPDRMELNIGSPDVHITDQLSVVGNDAGYKLYCSRLPAKTAIQIVVATADIKQTDGTPTQESLSDKNATIRVKNADNFSSAWYGRPGGDYYVRGQRPSFVVIEGTYVALWKPRHVKVKYGMSKVPGAPGLMVFDIGNGKARP